MCGIVGIIERDSNASRNLAQTRVNQHGLVRVCLFLRLWRAQLDFNRQTIALGLMADLDDRLLVVDNRPAAVSHVEKRASAEVRSDLGQQLLNLLNAGHGLVLVV